MTDSERALRRVERNALAVCLMTVLGAWIYGRGGVWPPLGVMGGALLAWVSYSGIRSGIDAAFRFGDGSRRGVSLGLVKFFTRYAILAGAAYLILVRLRLPIVAVFAGASTLVAAVTIEAFFGPPSPRPGRSVERGTDDPDRS